MTILVLSLRVGSGLSAEPDPARVGFSMQEECMGSGLSAEPDPVKGSFQYAGRMHGLRVVYRARLRVGFSMQEQLQT